jgi:hypothetical protein
MVLKALNFKPPAFHVDEDEAYEPDQIGGRDGDDYDGDQVRNLREDRPEDLADRPQEIVEKDLR